MDKHQFLGLRVGMTGTVLIALLAISTGPVAADTTPPGDASYRQVGSGADAFSSDCTTDGDTTTCANEQISVFIGKMTDSVTGVSHSSQLCVMVESYTYSELTGEFVGSPTFDQGCRTDVPAGAIRIDSKLRSASLAPTTVSVEDVACQKFGCDPGSPHDVLVSATWVGFGALQSSKSHGSSGDGTCRTNESFKGSSRSADVTFAIDDATFTVSDSGDIYSGRYSFQSRCREV